MKLSNFVCQLLSGLHGMLFCTVTDAVLRNVALNKPSYQVSAYTDEFGEHNASLANDGNVNSCARSQIETNPWWAVDVGVETVAQVNLTNRGDDAGIVISTLLRCS